jgi:hypothetical protein
MRVSSFDFLYRAPATATFFPKVDLAGLGKVCRFVQIDKESPRSEDRGLSIEERKLKDAQVVWRFFDVINSLLSG